MTVADIEFRRTRVRPRRTSEDTSTPESREVARLEALLADPRKAGFRAELQQELAAARAKLVALTATTVLAA
jgi:hypothetical protein